MRKTQHSSAVLNSSNSAASASLPASRIAPLAASYLIVGDISFHSDRTIGARRDLLHRLVWFLEHKEHAICDRQALMLFLHHVQHGHKEPGGRWGNPKNARPTRPRTVKNYHGILRAFFNWCVAEEEIARSPMDRVPVPIDRPDQIQPFTHDQLNRMVAAAKKTLNAKRDEAILLLMLDTGIRASELSALRLRDVDIQNGFVSVEGKGGKQRRLPFSRDTKKALYSYLAEDDDREQNSPVFRSDRGVQAGDSLTRHGLRFLIVRIGKSAGIDGTRCSPHTFRHTFAVEFLRSGGNVFTLKQLLGHTDLAMTNRYVAIAQADIETQHRQHSPVARLKGR